MARLAVQIKAVQIDTARCRVDGRSAAGQHADGLAVIQHVALAFRRCIDIQRNEGRGAFAHRQLADQKFH